MGWTSVQNRDVDASGPYVIDPRTGTLDGPPATRITIDCSRDFPLTSASNDMASSYAKSNASNANQVTVITCIHVESATQRVPPHSEVDHARRAW